MDFEVQKARESHEEVKTTQDLLDTAKAEQKAMEATYEELQQEAISLREKEVALKAKPIDNDKSLNWIADKKKASSERAVAEARVRNAQKLLASATETVQIHTARLREILPEVNVDQGSEDMKDSSPNNGNEFSTEAVLRAPLGNIGMTKQADVGSWTKQTFNSLKDGSWSQTGDNLIHDTAKKIGRPGGIEPIGLPGNSLPMRVPLRK